MYIPYFEVLSLAIVISIIAYYWPFYGLIFSTASLAIGTELIEEHVPHGIALAILSFVEMLPELGVELSIVMMAVFDPKFIIYISSNFTGANRILIGIGWPIIFFVLCLKNRSFVREVELDNVIAVYAIFLLTVNVLYFYIVFFHELNIFIGVIMIFIFLIFLYVQYRIKSNGRDYDEYMKITKKIRERGGNGMLYVLPVVLIVGGGILLYISADPFVTELMAISSVLGISTYYFIQWVAPFITEFPELSTAALWSKNGKGSTPLAALVSSQFEQWSVMIGVIPIVYFIFDGGHPFFIPLDNLQVTEVLLTVMQSLFSAVILLKMKIKQWEFIVIFVLWIADIVSVSVDSILNIGDFIHIVIIVIYALLIVTEIYLYHYDMKNLLIRLKKMYTQ
ncbi:MAG: hypothetical protein M1481_03385 [Candidatus Thermoplasmatota archaeon]|nr:hypothetical protein [Candidatus Thermoplasmatota archaeon]